MLLKTCLPERGEDEGGFANASFSELSRPGVCDSFPAVTADEVPLDPVLLDELVLDEAVAPLLS